jgi:hypothetical protein
VNPLCTSIGGAWNTTEQGSATYYIGTSNDGSESVPDPIGGTGTEQITQTGCSISYLPIYESGLVGVNLTASELAPMTRTGTVSGNSVTVSGLLAVVDTVAAFQAGVSVANVSANRMNASGQVSGNYMTVAETESFNASGTYSIEGDNGTSTVRITSSTSATFQWPSGARAAYLAPGREKQSSTLSPLSVKVSSASGRTDVATLVRAALRKALIYETR